MYNLQSKISELSILRRTKKSLLSNGFDRFFDIFKKRPSDILKYRDISSKGVWFIVKLAKENNIQMPEQWEAIYEYYKKEFCYDRTNS